MNTDAREKCFEGMPVIWQDESSVVTTFVSSNGEKNYQTPMYGNVFLVSDEYGVTVVVASDDDPDYVALSRPFGNLFDATRVAAMLAAVGYIRLIAQDCEYDGVIDYSNTLDLLADAVEARGVDQLNGRVWFSELAQHLGVNVTVLGMMLEDVWRTVVMIGKMDLQTEVLTRSMSEELRRSGGSSVLADTLEGMITNLQLAYAGGVQ